MALILNSLQAPAVLALAEAVTPTVKRAGVMTLGFNDWTKVRFLRSGGITVFGRSSYKNGRYVVEREHYPELQDFIRAYTFLL